MLPRPSCKNGLKVQFLEIDQQIFSLKTPIVGIGSKIRIRLKTTHVGIAVKNVICLKIPMIIGTTIVLHP